MSVSHILYKSRYDYHKARLETDTRVGDSHGWYVRRWNGKDKDKRLICWYNFNLFTLFTNIYFWPFIPSLRDWTYIQNSLVKSFDLALKANFPSLSIVQELIHFYVEWYSYLMCIILKKKTFTYSTIVFNLQRLFQSMLFTKPYNPKMPEHGTFRFLIIKRFKKKIALSTKMWV